MGKRESKDRGYEVRVESDHWVKCGSDYRGIPSGNILVQPIHRLEGVPSWAWIKILKDGKEVMKEEKRKDGWKKNLKLLLSQKGGTLQWQRKTKEVE